MNTKRAQLHSQSSSHHITFVPDLKGDEETPFPETDFSPTLQRTIKRKIESGEDPGMDRGEFFRLLGQVAEPQEPSPES